MKAFPSNVFSRSITPCLFYLCLLLGVGVLSFKKPSYNWDMLAYTAVILQYDAQTKDVHQMVYQLASRQLPADTYDQLAGASNPERKNWKENDAAFHQKLPVYVIKPLYTMMAYGFYKLGIPIFKATVVPSVIAYIMTGILLLIWLNKYLKPVHATITCSMIMLLPPVLEAAKLSTPDFLAGMLLFYGVYFMVEKASVTAFFIFGILAVLSRIDFILPLLILLPALTFLAKELSVGKLIAFMSIAVVVYLLIASNALGYGWNMLYFPSFFHTLNPKHEVRSAFSMHDYWELLKAQVMTALYHSHFVWLLLIATLTLLQYRLYELKSNMAILIIISLLFAIAARFLLQPVIADRFYIGYYLIFVTLFVVQLTKRPRVMVH
ncbi:hypothetical protein [Mucilaginibacter jinjuensis]|uniref:Dolichyl-phosphate-mannose-protein mannosyltransferase n=1 Tax=Mucilaginibacter jinjuensis TaxID=1176721 RepID=A0ABY7T757_9SPHI|nr:hypothetical protein [Mucilaginibacter jinjuensis]WCT12058.1 hypothetical protein PQO05_25330 [Mucilaginibacter jinjuensis]